MVKATTSFSKAPCRSSEHSPDLPDETTRRTTLKTLMAAVTTPFVAHVDNATSSEEPARNTADGNGVFARLNTCAAKAVVQHRSRITYYSTTQVSVTVPPTLIMCGFRSFGSYMKSMARIVSTQTNGRKIVSLTTDLGAEASAHKDNWYAVFACSFDDASGCSFKLMPFMTVKSVANRVVAFGLNGQGQKPEIPTSYTIANNELAGVDVLICEENGALTSRVVSCTANTAASITLDEVGSLAQGDRILCAPPGHNDYCYLGTFYADIAPEPQNIADMGDRVGALVPLNVSGVPETGQVSPAMEISLRSYVSPLATGGIIAVTQTIQAGSSGDYAEYFWHDSSHHEIERTYVARAGTAQFPVDRGAVVIPFSQKQNFYYSTAGALHKSIAYRSIQVRGWFEP